MPASVVREKWMTHKQWEGCWRDGLCRREGMGPSAQVERLWLARITDSSPIATGEKAGAQKQAGG